MSFKYVLKWWKYFVINFKPTLAKFGLTIGLNPHRFEDDLHDILVRKINKSLSKAVWWKYQECHVQHICVLRNTIVTFRNTLNFLKQNSKKI